ncbi:MAG: AMP-binding protein, partial [Pseudomonadota bacterium]
MTRMPPPDPAKTAVVIAETGETLTHGELAAIANRYGHAFRALGLGVGDGVAWCVGNSPAFFKLLLASHRSGLYYTPVSTYLGPKEIAYIVRDCGARVFVVSQTLADNAQALRELLESHVELYSIGGGLPGYTPLEPLADDRPTTLPEAATTGQDLLYSSGTTGQPKGIKLPLPDRAIDEISPAGVATMHLYRWSPDVTYLSPAPLYHAAPLRFNLLNMIVGGTSVVLRHFD